MTDTAEIIARSLCMAGEAGIDCECEKACETCLVVARVAIAALTEAGMTIVPAEPTDAMIGRGLIAHWPVLEPNPVPNNGDRMRASYKAMIGAGK